MISTFRASDVRVDYGKLGALCALFADLPRLAMTATASQTDMKTIQDSLGLKQCKFIVVNPEKIFRCGEDADALKSILIPIAKELLKRKNRYPITIV